LCRIAAIRSLSSACRPLWAYYEIEEFKAAEMSNSSVTGKTLVFSGTMERFTRQEAKAQAERPGVKGLDRDQKDGLRGGRRR
jgi:NAD-dependent DNA ligase